MSTAEDFAASREAIVAIPEEMILTPTIPVDNFVQEAENLAKWCFDDVELLTPKGVDIVKIEALSVRSGACREAQSIWIKNRTSVQDAKKQWDEQAPAAYDLRDELIHDFRYAFRNDSKLLGRVSEIADGSGDADMIQDLNDLSVLGNDNVDLLTEIDFDISKLTTAATLADSAAEVLAVANGAKEIGNESKEIRDRSYTYLKEAVDEIRACGKYVFWKDKKRIKGYYSNYWRKINSSNKSKSTEDNPKSEAE